MPPRALEALRAADTVCAEDTRVTGKLLAVLGVRGKPLERLDENVIGQRAAAVAERVAQGERIAYCSDAGMPGVSDPGMRLVRAARERGIPVEVLPGPTAVATAYVASGCANDTFYFGGFFPRKDAARSRLLKQLASLESALIFYESPNRIVAALNSIADTLPMRTVTVCRELTKLHEEVLQGTAADLHAELTARPSVKGEIVLVIEGPTVAERTRQTADAADAAEARAAALAAEGLRTKPIARQLESEFGLPRNRAYDIAMAANATASAGANER